MLRKKKVEVQESSLSRTDTIEIDGYTISHGDIIKIRGQYGSKFKFQYFVTNNKTGAQWIDCFEVIGGIPSVFRSFKADQIKRIPQKGKRVRRRKTDSAS